jgi:hypothetical protein
MTIADATEALGDPATIAGYTNPVQPRIFSLYRKKVRTLAGFADPAK